MPIAQRTPGPIHLFCRFRGTTTGLYMGTAVQAPEPEHEKKRIPVFNDIGGRSVPFQIVQDGEDAIVMATLNRFNYLLLQSLRALDSGTPPGGLAGNALAGSEIARARGTFKIGYSDWELILINEYAGTPSAGTNGAATDLPAGRIYFSADLQKYKESTVGTRVLEVGLAIKCENIARPGTGALSGIGGSISGGGVAFRLYSDAPAELGQLEPVS